MFLKIFTVFRIIQYLFKKGFYNKILLTKHEISLNNGDLIHI